MQRFRHEVERLTGPFTAETRLGVAVSGGPDSLALLLLAHQVFSGQVLAATVDHGLRPDAAAEAEYVANICEERGIAHKILKPATPITGNIQSAARAARYALLEDWAQQNACVWIATAHHADDQLETLLMRLARGSGVDGLSGIRARNGRIIRPLLGFLKSELISVCREACVEPVEDPSNGNSDFDRVRIRQFLEATSHPLDPASAARSASALADASSALDWMTSKLAEERITFTRTSSSLNPETLPRELLRRLLIMALRHIEPDIAPRGDTIERALTALNAGEIITVGNILCKGGQQWQFSKAKPRRNG